MLSVTPVHGLDLTGQIKLIKPNNLVLYEPIGAGAFTNVFKGEWKTNSSHTVMVAVKTWRIVVGTDEKTVEDLNRRLERESEVWNKLKHKNVLPYHGYCSGICKSYALVSPLCELGTITAYLKNNRGVDRLKLLLDVLAGLEYLHANQIDGESKEIVVHGDISSNNILIDEHRNACLSDFGRAKILGEPRYSTKLMAGSLPYMAPELVPEEDTEVDKLFTVHSDMYAFGILAFEILVGRLPLSSKSPLASRASYIKLAHGMVVLPRPRDDGRRVTDALWEMMKECWVKDSAKRPSAGALYERIKNPVS